MKPSVMQIVGIVCVTLPLVVASCVLTVDPIAFYPRNKRMAMPRILKRDRALGVLSILCVLVLSYIMLLSK